MVIGVLKFYIGVPSGTPKAYKVTPMATLASAYVFPAASALRPPSVFSASFGMDMCLYLKRKVRVLKIRIS